MYAYNSSFTHSLSACQLVGIQLLISVRPWLSACISSLYACSSSAYNSGSACDLAVSISCSRTYGSFAYGLSASSYRDGLVVGGQLLVRHFGLSLIGTDDEEEHGEYSEEEDGEKEEGDHEPWFVDTFSDYDADVKSADDDGFVIDLTYHSECTVIFQ
ncbi:hypothetical protein PF006_g6685 [Phytophthora fragariae]|uniref:Uncharacterized protein n=1 Tax=Phytophthora fragariae TaxID=53985 RepID=A0A6A3UCW2_9STRA|nr:hypothetical protein PF006_g6685 [Phytophthora fragariae]